MALRLNTHAEPVWVTEDQLVQFDPSIIPDPDMAYLVRPLGLTDAQRLRQPFVTMRFDSRTHQKVEADMTPEQKRALSIDIMDFFLVDWRGVVQDDGITPDPCTRDNKALFHERDSARASALFQFAKSLQSQRAEDRAASFRRAESVGGVGGEERRHDAVLPDGAA